MSSAEGALGSPRSAKRSIASPTAGVTSTHFWPIAAQSLKISYYTGLKKYTTVADYGERIYHSVFENALKL